MNKGSRLSRQQEENIRRRFPEDEKRDPNFSTAKKLKLKNSRKKRKREGKKERKGRNLKLPDV